ncbi:M16 family metallopeptidase [Magnetovibrio blakemorei]|nr:pitrilysin family protein [Magnetovibrio blakemorei]
MTDTTVRITTLDNGLRVISDEMPNVETASAGVWIEAGARFESQKVNGVSHMLEHMTFKGTRKRSAQAIAEEIEDVGGHINAYTSRENTAYYAKVLKEDLGLAVDMVADLVQNAVLDAEELERERGVILQEINQAQDTPDDVVFDMFQDACYPDQALGRPVLGTLDGIGQMPRSDIVDFMSDHYRPSSMVLSAVGNLNHEQLLDLAHTHFDSAPSKSPGDTQGPAKYIGGDMRESRDIEQVQLMLGFEGFSYFDEDFYAASVMSMLFGGGMSSRLFQEVREKRGLVYSVYSFMAAYADGGVFGIYAGTGEKDVIDLIPVVCDEIGKLDAHVSAEELHRAKAQLKSSILMNLESTSSRAEQLARQLMIFGRPIPTEEAVNHIEVVDIEAIKRVAGRIFKGTPTVAALGPISHLEDFNKITERLN